MRNALDFMFLFLLLLFLSCFEPTFQQLSSRTERVALLELRSSLGLRGRDWPIKADPCSVWNGVECRNGRVIGINVSGFRRTRLGRQNPQFVVDALANLTLLQSFNASRFLLPGAIPDWLGSSLKSLQVLDLRSCSILGPIPLSFGNLTNLTTLYLSNNKLNGSIPASFGQLIRLSVLDLARNELTGSIPLSVSSLGNLKFLDLSSNRLDGSVPPLFGSLRQLQQLNLSSNNLSSSLPASLGDLGVLVDLDISFNKFSGPLPPDLKGMSRLQRMLLRSNLLGGSLPDALFSSLTQLQALAINDNRFTGAAPDVLFLTPGLRFLDISGNNFTGMLPNSSLNSNSTDGTLNISRNMFYGSLVPVLGRFRVIDLSGNYFEGRVPNFVSMNASLETNCLQNVSSQRTLEDCSSFYTAKGLDFDNFGKPSSAQPPLPEKSGKNKINKRVIILASVFGGIGFIVFMVLLAMLLFLYIGGKRASGNQRGVSVGPIPTRSSELPPDQSINFSSLGDVFTDKQLLQATGGFSDENLIKLGHSGDLFRGVLDNGANVVIKKIDLRTVKKETYRVELDFFSKASHTRLVPLLGHCLDNEHEKFLVYKYMPNGDLASSLVRKSNVDDENVQSLDWITRLKIASGAAEGLAYMHHECSPPLVHRDVQASSILLDDKFEVRLGSLSEVCAEDGDSNSHQNRISRLLRLPQSSEQGSSGSQTSVCSYDVYCFGKVLLELVTGKDGISGTPDTQLKEFYDQTFPYINIHDKELVTKIIDPNLIIDEDFLEEAWAMAVVAKSCLNPKPSRRPQMRYILKALENPLKVVRQESSGRLQATSSRSWNAALFGSWRQSLSDITVVPAATMSRAVGGSFKQSGSSGSQGSGQNNGGEVSRRMQSKEIFPEPPDEQGERVEYR
ncbi:probable LRR receptor-like serine/threonine-protein kinase At2g16250 [Cucurbita pepo subsp. pepo]|uniref:probable LRR receptor-like serine/threonine-protein kinase At2g16250 n=1 Tax=Cucurbita pepo subsp. pepo TaxID=3664 RepID=UPI000C9D8534|nr:probable LRR receptor-like serine/threonine-protein kinase At2g16250 [Cucurbita pepo subsp. pepo]